MILKNSEYNEKVDLMLCKNLIFNENNLDYLCLKLAYKNNKSKTKTERDLLFIKNYFYYLKSSDYDLKHLLNFYVIMTKDLIVIEDLINILDVYESNMDIKEKLKRIVFLVKDATINNKVYFTKLILVFLGIRDKNEIFIPYKIVSKLYVSILNNNSLIDEIFNYLEYRTNEFNAKISMQDIDLINQLVIEKCIDFCARFNIQKFGIYGSFGTGEQTCYSDLDLFIVVLDVESYQYRQSNLVKYWKDVIPFSLKVDVVITDSKNIGLLNDGLIKTLKIIWEKKDD